MGSRSAWVVAAFAIGALAPMAALAQEPARAGSWSLKTQTADAFNPDGSEAMARVASTGELRARSGALFLEGCRERVSTYVNHTPDEADFRRLGYEFEFSVIVPDNAAPALLGSNIFYLRYRKPDGSIANMDAVLREGGSYGLYFESGARDAFLASATLSLCPSHDSSDEACLSYGVDGFEAAVRHVCQREIGVIRPGTPHRTAGN